MVWEVSIDGSAHFSRLLNVPQYPDAGAAWISSKSLIICYQLLPNELLVAVRSQSWPV